MDAEAKRPRSLLDELRRHQAELETQNEQLRQTQLELEQARDQYRRLYDEAPVGYVTLSRSGFVLRANQRAAALLDHESPAALCRHRLEAFMDENDADTFQIHLRALLKTGGEQSCVVWLTRGGGVRRLVRLRSRCVAEPGTRSARASAARDDHLLVVLEDITEEREAADKLASSERRFRQFAEVIEDIFYVRLPDDGFQYVSPAFEHVSGYSVDDLRAGRIQWLDLVASDDRPLVEQTLSNAAKGDPIDHEYRIRHRDGTLRWIHDRAFAVEDERENLLHYVGVARDISNERELEHELHQAQRMEAIGSLAAGIAHDFRNLLQGILGCATLALDDASETEKVRRLLLNVINASKRGASLTDQLLGLSHRQSDLPGTVGLDTILTEIAPLAERLVGEHVTFVLELGAPDAELRGDRVQIERILLNLAANAADAMPQGGTLTIRTQTVGLSERECRRRGLKTASRFVRLEVSDTGAGMDHATRQRIFDPFFTTKQLERGTGLGLASVLAITKRLGGNVDVDSAPGRGTRFWFHFPCAIAPKLTLMASPARLPQLSGTILLVEDDAVVRMVIQRYLVAAGLSVVAVPGARDALERYPSLPEVRAVVSDVMMPQMSGPVLVSQLCERHGPVPALYLSAHDGVDLIASGILKADDTVLQKPVDMTLLLESLEALLARAPQPRLVSESGEVHSVCLDRPRVVIVDDCEATRMVLHELLGASGYTVLAFGDPIEALRSVEGSDFDLLISDLDLPSMSGSELARRLSVSHPRLPVLFVSGSARVPPGTPGTLLRKPVDLDVLARAIEDSLSRPFDRATHQLQSVAGLDR